MQHGSKTSLATFLLTMAIIFGLTFWMVESYVMALLTGGFMAMIARPLYLTLRRKISTSLAAGFATAGLVLLVILPLAVFMILVARQAVMIGAWASQLQLTPVDDLLVELSGVWPISIVADSPDALKKLVLSQLNQWGAAATKLMVELAKGLPDNIMQLVLSCLTCFFVLIDGRRLIHWIGSLIPLGSQIRGKLAESFKSTAISVVWASMAAAGAQAVMMGVAFLLTGIPASALAAAATFIFAWIPLLGSVPVCLAGAVYLYAQGHIVSLIGLLVLGALTSVVDNVVRPWVLRGRGEMHPLVSLVAIFGGIKMFGIMGVFFGPILVACLLTLLHVWPTVARSEGLDI